MKTSKNYQDWMQIYVNIWSRNFDSQNLSSILDQIQKRGERSAVLLWNFGLLSQPELNPYDFSSPLPP